VYLLVHFNPGLTCGAFAFSFALIQKKQKIKENPPVGGQAPIAPHVFPACARQKPADRYYSMGEQLSFT